MKLPDISISASHDYKKHRSSKGRRQSSRHNAAVRQQKTLADGVFHTDVVDRLYEDIDRGDRLIDEVAAPGRAADKNDDPSA
jgi:hypothetical protein